MGQPLDIVLVSAESLFAALAHEVLGDLRRGLPGDATLDQDRIRCQTGQCRTSSPSICPLGDDVAVEERDVYSMTKLAVARVPAVVRCI
jgi:hypothetical protein